MSRQFINRATYVEFPIGRPFKIPGKVINNSDTTLYVGESPVLPGEEIEITLIEVLNEQDETPNQ